MVAVETSSAPDFGPFLTYLQLCKKTRQKKRHRGDLGQKHLRWKYKTRIGEGGPVEEGRRGGCVGICERGMGIGKRGERRGWCHLKVGNGAIVFFLCLFLGSLF